MNPYPQVGGFPGQTYQNQNFGGGYAPQQAVQCGRLPDVVNLRTFHGKFVCADANRGLVADRDNAAQWEAFTVQYHGDKVSLRSWNNNYICAESNGSVVVNRTQVGIWEQFTPYFEGDKVAFLTHHGTYLSANQNNLAQQPHRQAWEFFTYSSPYGSVQQVNVAPQYNLGNRIALRGHHGKYLCAEGNGSLICNRDKVGDWEKFVVERINPQQIRLRTAHGKYVSIQIHGQGSAQQTSPGQYETFEYQLFLGQPPKIALRSCLGWVGTQPDCFVWGNRGNIGEYEMFEITDV